MKTQIFCFKTIISKMATMVRFVQFRHICQCGVYTIVGINYFITKNNKRVDPYIATHWEILYGKFVHLN